MHRLALALALLLPTVATGGEREDAGAYLAGRHAQIRNDFAEAARYLAQGVRRDATNREMLEGLIGAHMSLGDFDSAAAAASRYVETGADNQIANLALATVAARDGAWTDLLDELEAGRSVGPLFDGLARGWALLGAERTDDALAAFDDLAGDGAVQAYGIYHKALALASLGRFDEAEALLSAEKDLRLTRRGLIARAQILTQLGQGDRAVSVLLEGFGPDLDPMLADLRDRAASGETLDFTVAPDARAGMAEAAHDIAAALADEVARGYTLLYSRAAQELRPDHVEAALLSAALLDEMGQYDLAIATYAAIPNDGPAHIAAELGRAEAMLKADRKDAAIEVLRRLAQDRPDIAVVQAQLGDALRDLDRFAEARDAYDRAVALFDTPQASQWVVYFARAVTAERTGDWPAAEADFRRALDLNPDQPQVLNYLGYSLVERREKLDEALDMIERAVAARPDSGYIVDSLAWVFYKLGRYDEAVAPMERAVQLTPVDPVLNDHLGDIYWAVGRHLEARFQWSRALSFADNASEEDIDADRIRRKLELGLDAVLEEEGADPLKVANDG
ncbi:hypothetical protein OCGS_1644 [Oceaniovalibus guishaninsula JLT2003]|uniref:Uncharacterized protein n=1 Tax=Oceaniovalibus guishaninsula JLT2003 TaxID=1231392 RepID=K2H995_9RHOB|nr:tetratricopeptide repeat protein [Oceaniovalibus guishaninsula]EKE44128.1 hypothetical protein OCGS_1644 [Oceaniovalibus guishaninsula JLT2003]